MTGEDEHAKITFREDDFIKETTVVVDDVPVAIRLVYDWGSWCYCVVHVVTILGWAPYQGGCHMRVVVVAMLVVHCVAKRAGIGWVVRSPCVCALHET